MDKPKYYVQSQLIVCLFKVQFNIQFRTQWPELSLVATSTLSWRQERIAGHVEFSAGFFHLDRFWPGIAGLPTGGAAGNSSPPRFPSTTALSPTDNRPLSSEDRHKFRQWLVRRTVIKTSGNRGRRFGQVQPLAQPIEPHDFTFHPELIGFDASLFD